MFSFVERFHTFLSNQSKSVSLNKTIYLERFINEIQKNEELKKLYEKEVGIIGCFILGNKYITDEQKCNIVGFQNKNNADTLRNICYVMHHYDNYKKFKKRYLSESPSGQELYSMCKNNSGGKRTRKKRNSKKKHRRSCRRVSTF